MSQTVRIIYQESDGTYRERKGKNEYEYPTILNNQRDKEAHYLDDNPVFSLPDLKRLPIIDRWEELLNCPPPPPPSVPKRLYMLCEDNNPYPISPKKDINLDDRVYQRSETRQEVLQNANIAATRESMGNIITSATALITLCIVAVFVALIALLVAQSQFLSKDSNETAVLGIFLLGAVAVPLPRGFNRARAKAPATPKVQRDLVYVVDRMFEVIWACWMPPQVLIENGVPFTARRSPNLLDKRRRFAIGGAIIFAAFGLAAMVPYMAVTGTFDLYVNGTAIPFGTVWIFPLGAGFGWLAADKFVRCHWIVYKDGEINEETNRLAVVISPFEHTFCRGIPKREWLAMANGQVNQYRDARQKQMDEYMKANYGGGSVKPGTSPYFGMDNAGELDGFEPIVMRATELWDSLLGVNEKGWLRTKKSTAQKVQMGATLALAGIMGVLLILIFSMTATG